MVRNFQYQLEEKKKYYFRKNSNTVGKTLLLCIGLQFVLSFVFQFAYIFIKTILSVSEYISVSGRLSYEEINGYILNVVANDPLLTTGLIYVPTAIIMIISNLIPVWYGSKKNGIRLQNLFQGVKPKTSFVLVSIVFLFGMNFAGGMIYQFINMGLSIFGLEAPDSSLAFPQNSLVGAIFYVLAVCIIAPITEELIFRGVLLRSLSRYNLLFASIATSVLFGVIHGNFGQMFSAFLMGLVLSYVTVKTGSIKLAIGLHMLNNTVSVVMEGLLAAFDKTSSGYTVILQVGNLFLIGCFIAAVILFIIFRRKIHFVSDDPQSVNRDEIIMVPKSYRNFFTSPFVLVFLVVMVVLMIFGILTM